MLERPGLTDAQIVAALRAGYDLAALRLEFLPLGNDSGAWSYRVETANGASYFLKARHGVPGEAALLIPRYLRDQGLVEVVAALPTASGALWQPVDGFGLILYPFVVGHIGVDAGLSDAQWARLGMALRELHATELPADLAARTPRESFVPPWGEMVKEVSALVAFGEYADPMRRELLDFWRAHGDEIMNITARAVRLGQRMEERALEFVTCHADIHTANVLMDDDGELHIVDWDGVILAPRERDLMHIVDDAADLSREEAAFFAGYGEVEVDRLAVAYYRYEWAVQELGDYAARVFLADDTGAGTKADAVRGLMELFEPGDVVDAAYAADRWL